LWVIDGTREYLPELTAALHRKNPHESLWGVLLAPEWSLVKDPAWTFFKVPLHGGRLYSWLDSRHSPSMDSVNPFTGQRLRLRRWPNMSRYASDSSMSSNLQLIEVCARLLGESVEYEVIKSLVPDIAMLYTLLRDAQQDGILEMTPNIATVGDVTSATQIVDNKKRDTSLLVKLLLQKFK
jgi:hypothetical protein